MDLISYAQSPLSLLAPAVAIGLAVITRKTLFSLAMGAVVGALLLTDWQVLNAAQYLFGGFSAVFWDGGLNTGSVFILLFLICLGITTSFISLSGGTLAFGTWARQRVSTSRDSQVMTVVLGIIIFIDDYFNALAVGNITRPISDLNKVPRAKLAYLIDSTAAPVCVLMPISSWGAYIIALIGSILVTHGVSTAPFTAFIEIIPMNFYALVALALVMVTAALDINIGPMKTHALQAEQGQLFNPRRGEPLGARGVHGSDKGSVADLLVPVAVLVVATILALIGTGAQTLAEANKPFSVLGAFENTQVAVSLLLGGLCGLVVSFANVLRHRIGTQQIVNTTILGAKSMLGAIYILVFAWVLVDVVGNLETGKYLSSLVTNAIDIRWLPALMFVLSGAMSFATGTSWGTFGVMLPIAGDMAAATEMAMMMPMMGAVLAGAVFGDHCSPISDTTILSSTGASCHHIDHVITQLPYCMIAAIISLIGYLVLGATLSVAVSLAVTLVLFIATTFVCFKISTSRATA